VSVTSAESARFDFFDAMISRSARPTVVGWYFERASYVAKDILLKLRVSLELLERGVERTAEKLD
jgi:hypothetical protein